MPSQQAVADALEPTCTSCRPTPTWRAPRSSRSPSTCSPVCCTTTQRDGFDRIAPACRPGQPVVSAASRREVLRAALLVAGAGLLAACGQAAPAAPQPTSRPTEAPRPASPTQTAPAAAPALVSVKY